MRNSQWHSLLCQALALLGHHRMLALEPQHGLPESVVVGLQGHQLGLPLHPAALEGAPVLVFASYLAGQVVDGRLQGSCRARAAGRLSSQALTCAGSPQLQNMLSAIASLILVRLPSVRYRQLVLSGRSQQHAASLQDGGQAPVQKPGHAVLPAADDNVPRVESMQQPGK